LATIERVVCFIAYQSHSARKTATYIGMVLNDCGETSMLSAPKDRQNQRNIREMGKAAILLSGSTKTVRQLSLFARSSRPCARPTTFWATLRRESRHAAGVSAHSPHCLTNMVAKESRTAKYRRSPPGDRHAQGSGRRSGRDLLYQLIR